MQDTDDTIKKTVPLQQRRRRRVAHLIDRVVDRRIFRNVGVALWDIGFRLVVIVITDEVLDSVVRKELLELLVELPCQRLIVHQHQCGLLEGAR